MSKQRATVNILNETYTVSGETEAQYIETVGQLVDERMRSVKQASPRLSSARIAVLVAINIADELLQAKDIQARNDKRLDIESARRATELISLVDEGIIADTPL